MIATDETEAAPSPPVSSAGEQPWERIRRLRQAQIEAETEHGRRLLERYGREQPRQRYAAVGHADAKRRRRR